jgi:hypothetical protein
MKKNLKKEFKMSDPIKKSKRIGAALLTAIAIGAQGFGADIDQEMIDKMAFAWNDMITAISGGLAIILGVWSKIKDMKK